MLCCIIIAIVLLIFYQRTESYSNCTTCDDYRMLDNGTPVLNPFVWPYSAHGNPDELYKDKNVLFGFKNEPLIHNFTPDHSILT